MRLIATEIESFIATSLIVVARHGFIFRGTGKWVVLILRRRGVGGGGGVGAEPPEAAEC